MINEQDREHFEAGYAVMAMISLEEVKARRSGASYNEAGTSAAYFWYCRGLKQGERLKIAAEKPSRQPVVTIQKARSPGVLHFNTVVGELVLPEEQDAHWREI